MTITTSNHNLRTGDKVRLASPGKLPEGLEDVDYTVTKIDINTIKLTKHTPIDYYFMALFVLIFAGWLGWIAWDLALSIWAAFGG